MLFFTAFVLRLPAEEVTDIPEIGAHEPILVVKKNVHPENLMVVYTKVDADGHFAPDPHDPKRPILDFYWLMDGKAYKPVNPLIKIEIRKHLELQTSGADANHFVINLNDLKEVSSDIGQPKVEVSVDGPHDVEAQMNLGPSDGNVRIRLTSIHTDGRAFPPAVYSVTLEGEKVANGRLTGKQITRRYDAKK
ncbi:hypothetical protein CfE428DRAFT_5502 [Chthoniobacter flavus Ellin428]|uniref:Uncharacterized protein n=1 Tax=Chthoniobacter flavus Ellin428 TaxID=497964 RepID=B4D9B2_9BACT|nr:hypothetical protein [Chthoniobacter flavus]EDY17015.1 hypothetical protein CfE428DRAFT_5502 [Chthoniobacter flavus Ellin428]